MIKEEHIQALKDKLVKWNPLCETGKFIPDLNDYETEAIDILFEADKKDEKNNIVHPDNNLRL